MTKKEKLALEEALTAAALRTTGDVEPDVPVPAFGEKGPAIGYATTGAMGDYPSVVHTKSWAPTLYSTRLLALRALRRLVEKHCAERLRRVDRMIEGEETR